MSHAFALAFDRPLGAERVFPIVRRFARDRVIELDDAWITVRGNASRPDVRHARLDGPLARLGTLFGRRRSRPSGLSPALVERFGTRLDAGASALVLSVYRLEPQRLRPRLAWLLEEHNGRVMRVAEVSEAAAPSFGEVPEALDLATAAAEEIEARARVRQAKAGEAHVNQRERLARMADPSHADEALRTVVQRCREAAGRGQFSALVYRFPSALATDRGRAVHAGDPTWPRTLTGEPLAVQAGIAQHLLPKGYALEAAVIDYPDGLLGDVGLYLRWGHDGG